MQHEKDSLFKEISSGRQCLNNSYERLLCQKDTICFAPQNSTKNINRTFCSKCLMLSAPKFIHKRFLYLLMLLFTDSKGGNIFFSPFVPLRSSTINIYFLNFLCNRHFMQFSILFFTNISLYFKM